MRHPAHHRPHPGRYRSTPVAARIGSMVMAPTSRTLRETLDKLVLPYVRLVTKSVNDEATGLRETLSGSVTDESRGVRDSLQTSISDEARGVRDALQASLTDEASTLRESLSESLSDESRGVRDSLQAVDQRRGPRASGPPSRRRSLTRHWPCVSRSATRPGASGTRCRNPWATRPGPSGTPWSAPSWMSPAPFERPSSGP